MATIASQPVSEKKPSLGPVMRQIEIGEHSFNVPVAPGLATLPTAFASVAKDAVRIMPFPPSEQEIPLFAGYQASLKYVEDFSAGVRKLIEAIGATKGWFPQPCAVPHISTAKTGALPPAKLQEAFLVDLLQRMHHTVAQLAEGLDWAVQGRRTCVLRWESDTSCELTFWKSNEGDPEGTIVDLVGLSRKTPQDEKLRPKSARLKAFLDAAPNWLLASTRLLWGAKVRCRTVVLRSPTKIETLTDVPVLQDPYTALVLGDHVLVTPGEDEPHSWEKIPPPPPPAPPPEPAPELSWFQRCFQKLFGS